MMDAGLSLCTDKQNRLAACSNLTNCVAGFINECKSFLEIDDIDTVTFGENEFLHLRVPASALMTKVNAGFEEILKGNASHVKSSHVMVFYSFVPVNRQANPLYKTDTMPETSRNMRDKTTCNSLFSDSEKPGCNKKLTFGKLIRSPCTSQTILLTFFHTRIAHNETGTLKNRPQV